MIYLTSYQAPLFPLLTKEGEGGGLTCCAFCTKHLNYTIDNIDYWIPAFAGMTSIVVVDQETNNGENLPL